MIDRIFCIAGSVMLIGLALVMGCADSSETPSTGAVPSPNDALPSSAPAPVVPVTPSAVTNTEEHGHKAGAHGGIMVSLGSGSYHAEAVFEKGGVLRLYTLGNDESRVIDVEKQMLKGFVKIEGESEAEQFTLQPAQGNRASG